METSSESRIRLLSLAITVLILSMIPTAWAAELHVPSEYATIQAAIDAANPGDEVILADGTYSGADNRDINFFGKAITVRSANGVDHCTIDCEGSDAEEHEGFNLYNNEKPDSILEGLTIRNGYSTFGGAIYISGSSPTIRNCRLVDNYAQKGGGLYSDLAGHNRIVNGIVDMGAYEF